MNDELKPCPNPWCYSVTAPVSIRGSGGWRVVCACGVYPPSHVLQDSAIAAWNRRSPDPTGLSGLHPSTADLVDRFAAALKEKLAKAEAKYGYSDGWLADDWRDDLVRDLARHVQKGDPRDVAAYCAFAWHHGWSTAEPQSGGGVRQALADMVQFFDGVLVQYRDAAVVSNARQALSTNPATEEAR